MLRLILLDIGKPDQKLPLCMNRTHGQISKKWRCNQTFALSLCAVVIYQDATVYNHGNISKAVNYMSHLSLVPVQNHTRMNVMMAS